MAKVLLTKKEIEEILKAIEWYEMNGFDKINLLMAKNSLKLALKQIDTSDTKKKELVSSLKA